MKRWNPSSSFGIPALIGLAALALGCAGETDPGGAAEGSPPQTDFPRLSLGPTDGLDLPPTEIDRVAVGTLAPDFSLRTLAGDTVTLSEFRGAKDVILVFYRGHW